MANDYFRFKQFTIQQSDCAMKVGTDGVLLGAWVGLENTEKVLDIGTGTGLLALMLAQRCPATVLAIEPDPEACAQADKNIKDSPWDERIVCRNTRLQDMEEGSFPMFDLIICNPPFYHKAYPAAFAARRMARHDVSLPLDDILFFAARYLSVRGRLAMILPADREPEVIQKGKEADLYAGQICRVQALPGRRPHRILLEMDRKNRPPVISSLIIEKYGRHKYSEDYLALTGDFYLNR